ncbi:MAG TPA: glycosyltransferase family A protein [Candidatus Limnocylindria bacterium]|nr:glycosyltransferase family A protein [Candidatus Limnocylindria bacterium]
MKLSLVICTRNRAPQLNDALQSLLKLDEPKDWELVIVDNGSTDDTAGVIERFRSRFPHDLIAIFEPDPGLAIARNRGWLCAGGDVIAFSDDDCYPAEDLLANIGRCFEEDPRLGFVGGRILLHDPTDYPVTLQRGEHREDISRGQFIPTGTIQGANLACRRAALESVGGFDERLGVRWSFPSEDIDVVARMSAQGWRGAFDPRLRVYHHHRRKSSKEAVPILKRYDRGRGAYYAKCLANPLLRRVCLGYWLGSVGDQSWRRTVRELAGCMEYGARAVAAWVRSPEVRPIPAPLTALEETEPERRHA